MDNDGDVDAQDAPRFYQTHGYLQADVNLDGSYTINDMNIIAMNYLTGTTLAEGDVTFDGIVNAAELNVIGQVSVGDTGDGPASPAASFVLRAPNTSSAKYYYATETSNVGKRPTVSINDDADGDALTFHDELFFGTDPGLNDTDGDGTPDSAEAIDGSNPVDATDGGMVPEDSFEFFIGSSAGIQAELDHFNHPREVGFDEWYSPYTTYSSMQLRHGESYSLSVTGADPNFRIGRSDIGQKEAHIIIEDPDGVFVQNGAPLQGTNKAGEVQIHVPHFDVEFVDGTDSEFFWVNDDDDDGDGIIDSVDSYIAGGDDDLIPISISAVQPNIAGGYFMLNGLPGDDPYLHVWADPYKNSLASTQFDATINHTLYLESPNAGGGEFGVLYFPDLSSTDLIGYGGYAAQFDVESGDIHLSAPEVLVPGEDQYYLAEFPDWRYVEGQTVTFHFDSLSSTDITKTATVSNGVASVTFGAEVTHGANRYAVRASLGGLSSNFHDSIVQTGFRIPSSGSPSNVTVTVSGGDVVAGGSQINNSKLLTATVTDAFGNAVPHAPVSWEIVNGTGRLINSLSGDTSVTGVAMQTIAGIDLPSDAIVRVQVGDIEHIETVSATEAQLSISGVAALDLASSQLGTVTVTSSNIPDGTEVFWTISNGDVSNVATVMSGGSATISLAATGNWARVGPVVVTATVAGKMVVHEAEFYDSGSHFELEHFVLSGDKTTNGVEVLDFSVVNSTHQGQPIWGFSPPPLPYLPAPRSVDYHAETAVTIQGLPNTKYYPVAGTVFDAFAQFEGLNTSAYPNGAYPDIKGEIETDSLGSATFTIRSKGALTGDFVEVDFSLREGSPFVGAPEEGGRLLMTKSTWWTRTKDGVVSFFGGNPQGVTGIATNVAGGMLIVGDVGSLVKNGWRTTPYSSLDPNYLEAGLSGLGLATELAVGVGEAADAPISGVRAIVAAVGKTNFTDALVILLKRGLQNAKDLPKFGSFVIAITRSQAAFDLAKAAYTSEELLEAAIKVSDDLGDNIFEILATKAQALGNGIRAASDTTTLLSKLSGNGLKFFKGLNPNQLDLAIDHLAVIFNAGKVDIASMKKLLEYDEIFSLSSNYGRLEVLRDLRKVADVDGAEKLVKAMANQSVRGRKGRVYELVAAAHLVDNMLATSMQFLSKNIYNSATGKMATDIDIVADGVYYQVKISKAAFRSLKGRRGVQVWVNKVVAEAGVNTPIKYITTTPNQVPSNIRTWFQNRTPMIDVIDNVPFP